LIAMSDPVKRGIYDLWQPAPIPEWQGKDDPRAKIQLPTIAHVERSANQSDAGS
jgi:hypothetical protein